MNIYSEIRELAKTVRAQNLFTAAKEFSSIRLFRNTFNFSKIQEIYLSYLYTYETINRDIIVDKISPRVLDCELFEDAYLIWKRQDKKEKKINKKGEPEVEKSKDMHLVCGNKIIFPTEVK
jgi:hypothetical protein